MDPAADDELWSQVGYGDAPVALRSGHIDLTFATFAGKASDHVATVDWADGTTSPGRIADNHDGTYSVIGSHDYAEIDATTFDVAVQIDGSDGFRRYVVWEVFANFDTITFLSTIEEARAMNHEAAFDGSYYLGWMYDMNAVGGDPSAYLVTVDWGDGTQSAGKASIDDVYNFGYSYDLHASHDYDHAGLYDVTVTVTRPAVAGEESAPIAVDHGEIEVITGEEFLARDRSNRIKRPNPWDGQILVLCGIAKDGPRPEGRLAAAPVAARSPFATTLIRTVASQLFADKSADSDREEFSLVVD
jgi:hypothetical protein